MCEDGQPCPECGHRNGHAEAILCFICGQEITYKGRSQRVKLTCEFYRFDDDKTPSTCSDVHYICRRCHDGDVRQLRQDAERWRTFVRLMRDSKGPWER